MNIDLSKMQRRPTRGSVIVEMTLVTSMLLGLIAFLTLLGQYFWYYDVAQKAAYDGARFLSTATQVEMRTVGDSGTEPAVAALARKIVMEELSEIAPHLYPVVVDVHCDFKTCVNKVPQTVRVAISMSLQENIFTGFTSMFTGQEGMSIVADVTVRYAGN